MLAMKRFVFPCVLQHLSTKQPSSNQNHTTTANYGLFSFTDTPKSIEIKPKVVQKEKTLERHAVHLVGRDFLNLKHFSNADIKQFLWTAKDLKTRIKDNGEIYEPLKGKTATLIFQKQSTHTRLSTELGMAKLGGHVCFLGPDDIHLGANESVKDTARVVASMADIILASVNSQLILDDLANESKIPVIGLSDLQHPLQTLADFMTLQENFGYIRGLKIAWIGCSNNVLHSLMYGCAKIGVDLNIATPAGYEPHPDVTADAVKLAGETGASFQFGHDPIKAVYRADAIITNSLASSSEQDEQETQKRLQDFASYRINRKMLKEAGADWVFLHSLLCQKGEVTEEIFYGSESLVWQEAENMMWIVMAVMLHLQKPYRPTIPMPKYVRG